MDLTALSTSGRRRRQTYSREFKDQAVATCQRPGVSLAAIAMDLRVNANILRRWVREVEAATLMRPVTPSSAITTPQLVPVSVAPSTIVPPVAELRVTVQHNGASIEIHVPPATEARAAALLREWLR